MAILRRNPVSNTPLAPLKGGNAYIGQERFPPQGGKRPYRPEKISPLEGGERGVLQTLFQARK